MISVRPDAAAAIRPKADLKYRLIEAQARTIRD